MRAAVVSGEPGAVDREDHRQALQADVMHDLIIGALQKRRIDADDGRMPSAARPAAKVTACCSAIPTSKKRSG